MSEIKNIIDTIDNVNDKFSSRLSATEKKLLDEVLNLIKQLNVSNGKIDSSIENLKLVSEIKSKLNSAVLNKDYLKTVAELSKGFETIYSAQFAYFKTLQKSLKTDKRYELVKQLSLESTMQGLTRAGIEANVTSKLSDMILKGVTTGSMYADMVKDMTAFLTTDEKSQGALTRYAQTYANTAVNQFAGQVNKTFTEDLGIEWFMYVGSNKETTREFCELLREKKYVHVSEIPDIIKGEIDGHQCKIYERTGLPHGMIEGTTPENFQVNNGGWNCGHKLTPVSEVVVPQEIKNKFLRNI